MSSALAIASVTYVLKDLLNNGLIDRDVSGATNDHVNITALPPDRIDIAPGQSQLNLYLYRITPNPGWANIGFPSRNHAGDRVSNPPLPMNLHYLLTAYGAKELHAEILLGYGMQLLHETPVLDRKAIRTSLMTSQAESGLGLPEELNALATSGLADQVEQIRISPEVLGTEDISRLWAAFGAKYRPTVAYEVSVILIEGRKSTRESLPVQKANLYVSPFHQPVIEKIRSQKAAGEPVVADHQIFAGYNLIISGHRLKGEEVVVNIGGKEVVPDPEHISDTEILLQLPAGITAGMHIVSVTHRKMMGSPPVAHRGVESNIASFILSPRIDPPVQVSNLKGTGNQPRSADIILDIQPEITDRQKVTLLLNELPDVTASDPSLAYSFQAPAMAHSDPPASTGTLTIPVSGVKAGDYLVRIRADGAESPVTIGPGGLYDAPVVHIP